MAADPNLGTLTARGSPQIAIRDGIELPLIQVSRPGAPSKTPPSERNPSGQSTLAEDCGNEDSNDEAELAKAIENDEKQASLAEALVSFREQFGEDAEPRQVLQVIKRLSSVDGGDFYLAFSLTYPAVAEHVESLCDCLFQLHNIISSSHMYLPSFTNSLSVLKYGWVSCWRWQFRDFWEVELPYAEWCSRSKGVRNAIYSVAQGWAKLQVEITQMDESIERLKEVDQNMESVVDWLEAEITVLNKTDEVARIAHEAQQKNSPEEEPIPGIDRSSSSTVELHTQPNNLRNRSHHQRNFHRAPLPHGEGNGHQTFPNWVRSALQWLRDHASIESMGHRYMAYNIVLIFSIAGATATGLAAWECGATFSKPTVDSNFWSTLSQALIGQAGLYCIIIPLLRRANIEARDPRLFRVLLVLSLATGLVSVIVYPFQIRASLILALVSSLAQLAATLQLVEDSGSKIQRASEEIVMLESELRQERRGRR